LSFARKSSRLFNSRDLLIIDCESILWELGGRLFLSNNIVVCFSNICFVIAGLTGTGRTDLKGSAIVISRREKIPLLYAYIKCIWYLIYSSNVFCFTRIMGVENKLCHPIGKTKICQSMQCMARKMLTAVQSFQRMWGQGT